MLLPQPIILAFSAKQPQRVGDRLAADVTTTARSVAQKPWNSVYKIFHFHFKRTFTSVNSSFVRPHCYLLFRWRVRLRNDHITMATNKLENVFWRCSSRTQLEAAGYISPILPTTQGRFDEAGDQQIKCLTKRKKGKNVSKQTSSHEVHVFYRKYSLFISNFAYC